MNAKFSNRFFRALFVFVLGTACLFSTTARAQTLNTSPIITEGDSISVTMAENSLPIPFNLTLHATDADGDTLYWWIISSPSHGLASPGGVGNSAKVGYEPNPNYTGTDSFVIMVDDQKGGTDTITVNVVVIPPTTGALDPTFGVGGIVFTRFRTESGGGVGANATAIQPDGKVIVAGYSNYDFALARYNADGSLDMNFGAAGKVTTDFGVGKEDFGNAVALQPDGRIVVAGYSNGYDDAGGWQGTFALARYNSDGSLDTTFGTDGKVTTQIITIMYGNSNAEAKAILLQPDGKIVVAGKALIGIGSPPFFYGYPDFTLARYNSDGSLDTGFGSGGIVTTRFDSNTGNVAFAIAQQSDGKIVAAGATSIADTYTTAFALARYNSDGSLDTTFGTSGEVITDIGHFDAEARSIVIQPDGRIVAEGYNASADNLDYDFAIVRYTSDGSLDTTFGIDGIVTTDIGYLPNQGTGVALQPDGKIVVTGDTWRYYESCSLARYNSNGLLDTSFGTAGKVIIDFRGGSCTAVTLQPDGRIILAGPGNAYSFGPNDFALARYDSQLVAISGNADIAGATLSYTDGIPRTATADYSGYYSFTVPSGWSGVVTPSNPGNSFFPASRNYLNVTAYETNQDYTATTQDQYTLTIISANGEVAKNPDQAFYHEGDVVQLTATPHTGWSFANWAGDLTSSVNPDSVTIHGNTTVAANYSQVDMTPPLLEAIGNKNIPWGNQLSFTAKASDSDTPSQMLTFSLEGAPTGAGITAGGNFTWMPASDQIGDTTVDVCVSDGTASTCENVNITVEKRPTQLVYIGDSSGQFSDPVTLKAALTDKGGGTLQGTSLVGRSVTFALGSQSATIPTISGGLAQTTLILNQAAGTPGVTSTFLGDSLYLSADSSNEFTVEKEDTILEYTGDTLKATSSTSNADTVNANLAAVIKEAADGNIGNKLNTTQVRFSVYKGTNTAMITPDASCTANIIATSTGVGSANCSVNLAVDNYTVKVELLANGYYSAPIEDTVVTVVTTGTGFSTGGGWITEPNLGTRSNFGFTIRYNKNGNIQGNSIYIYRVTTDLSKPLSGAPTGLREYNWIIKSNATTALIQSCTKTLPKVCSATFTGKNNITAVDRITGIAYSLGGNYQFQVDVTDRGEPGSGATPDTYAIRVWNGTGTYYQLGIPKSPIAINGGNIQVKP